MDIDKWLTIAKSKKASDIHISAGSSPLIRVNGVLMHIDDVNPLT